MTWHVTHDIGTFDAATGGFIAATAARNTLLVTVPAVVRRRGPNAFGAGAARFGWFEDADGSTTAAFVETPPRPIVLSDAAADVAGALAGLLADADEAPVSGVNGPAAAAEAFGEAWCARTGATSEILRRERLYRLGTLTPPSPAPPGHARIATRVDRELLIEWYQAFAEDTGVDAGNVELTVDERIEFGDLLLWEIDSVPVALAGRTQVQEGTARVAPVYTPKNLRGRGYAGAATAAVSRGALDAGAQEVLLFTDLANPTSNGLYQRIGYRPIEDRVVLRFEPS